MKKLLSIVLLFAVLTACESDSFNNRNPYIPNIQVLVDINMNLPQYSQLQFPSNAVFVFGHGYLGLIVFNTGSGYVAYDAACPNQQITNCSTMDIEGISAICPCDGAEYNLFDGYAPGLEYPMKRYRVDVMGNVLRISN